MEPQRAGGANVWGGRGLSAARKQLIVIQSLFCLRLSKSRLHPQASAPASSAGHGHAPPVWTPAATQSVPRSQGQRQRPQAVPGQEGARRSVRGCAASHARQLTGAWAKGRARAREGGRGASRRRDSRGGTRCTHAHSVLVCV
jgi:hypothetical protein